MRAQLKSMPQIGLATGTLSAEVLSIVSHDLRSPLATISMATSLLDDLSRPAEERVQMVQMVKRATQRMDRLVRDMLEVSRLDAGAHAARRRPVRSTWRPCSGEACEAQSAVAAAAGLTVECEIPDTLPAVRVDCDRVHQVISNLVGNAMKFTPAGGRITIAARAADEEVEVSVQDTGAGMSAEDLGRVFEPYWQAQRTASLGAGLGLKIAGTQRGVSCESAVRRARRDARCCAGPGDAQHRRPVPRSTLSRVSSHSPRPHYRPAGAASMNPLCRFSPFPCLCASLALFPFPSVFARAGTTRKVIITEPSSTTSPSARRTGPVTGRSRRRVPLRLPRSSRVATPSSMTMRAWRRETDAESSHATAPASRPSTFSPGTSAISRRPMIRR